MSVSTARKALPTRKGEILKRQKSATPALRQREWNSMLFVEPAGVDISHQGRASGSSGYTTSEQVEFHHSTQSERQARLRCSSCGIYHAMEKEMQDRGKKHGWSGAQRAWQYRGYLVVGTYTAWLGCGGARVGRRVGDGVC